MILKYRPHVMRFLGRSNPKTNQPCANKISKPLDLEWNTMGGYMPQDAPAYVSRSIFLSCFFHRPSHTETSDQPTIPPPLQYSQMDWKREPYPVPPQFYPGPPPFPPTPYMGAAYTPSQYSPTSPFPMPYSPPTQYSPAPAYSG